MISKDFTIYTYKKLLESLGSNSYLFISFEDYINNEYSNKKIILLRHDIDRNPDNALRMAQIENNLGIRAEYFFRAKNKFYYPEIISEIIKLGHKIGYHYEDLTSSKGNYEKAIKLFNENLNKLRMLYPITTISMHGSPLSKWNNREIWKKYDYSAYGIVFEPFINLDFDKIFYVTDSSRLWNNRKVTLRDNVVSNINVNINSVFDIYNLMKENKLPHRIALSIHPHNWANSNFEWCRIYVWQAIKNLIKQIYKKLFSNWFIR